MDNSYKNLITRLTNYWKSKINFFSQNKLKEALIKRQYNFDKKLVLALNKSKIPNFKQLKQLPQFLSLKEKKIIKILSIIIFLSLIFVGGKFSLDHLKIVPEEGGKYIEGLVGTPHYINPILAQTNDVDLDLSRLIFSGLVKYNEKQELIPDLAESFTLSEDAKTYTFYLKKNILWHDGKNLKADDVIFTVKSIQDQQFRSPLYISLKGVEIQKIDDYSLRFTLPKPYTPFLGVLTFGIIPEHLWYNIPPTSANLAEYNIIKPIGTGPWQFKALTKDKLGNIKSYTVAKNENYYAKKPYLDQITFRFYPNFEEAVLALKNKNIQGLSYLPREFKEDFTGYKNLKFYFLHLPQYTAVFFNQNKNEILKNKKIREALTLSINKERILREVLDKTGEIIHGPILPGFVGYNPEIQKFDFNPTQANEILEELGWKKISKEEYYDKKLKEALAKLEEEKKQEEKNETNKTENSSSSSQEKNQEENKNLTSNTEKQKEITEEESPATASQSPEEIIKENLKQELDEGPEFYRQKENSILEIALTTVDQPEKIRTAQIIRESWQKIGFKVNLSIESPTKIKNEVIKPREYQAFIYGVIVGADPDPYPFWHSSQNQDPGVNLAVFGNREVDKLLEEARQSSNFEDRHLKYRHFQNILVAEIPAIFLYNPLYTYVVDQKIQGINLTRIIVPADRFVNLNEWYAKKMIVWR